MVENLGEILEIPVETRGIQDNFADERFKFQNIWVASRLYIQCCNFIFLLYKPSNFIRHLVSACSDHFLSVDGICLRYFHGKYNFQNEDTKPKRIFYAAFCVINLLISLL